MKHWIVFLLIPFLFACTTSDQAAPKNFQLPDEPVAESEIEKDPEKLSGNCSLTTEQNFSQIIDRQLTAFAVKDFESAYELTSTRFKSGYSLDRFIGVITEFYPSLLDNTDFSASQCLEMGFTGFYKIDVKSLTGDITLRYRFEYVENTWFIAGAELIPEDETQVPA
jgi:hypothetical protein